MTWPNIIVIPIIPPKPGPDCTPHCVPTPHAVTATFALLIIAATIYGIIAAWRAGR